MSSVFTPFKYTTSATDRRRSCSRPSCAVVLTDPLRSLCPDCQENLDATLAEIVALQAEAKKERLKRQAVQS